TKLVFAAPASFLSAACAVHSVVAVSFTHLLTKLVFAAPASFLSAACVVQLDAASFVHLLTKLVLAAPDSFFSVAWASQLASAAKAIGLTNNMSAAAKQSFFMAILFGWTGPRRELSGERVPAGADILHPIKQGPTGFPMGPCQPGRMDRRSPGRVFRCHPGVAPFRHSLMNALRSSP